MRKQLLAPALIAALVLLFAACAKTVAAGDWQEQYDLGVRYLSEGNYQEAILAFTAAIEIDPKRPDAYLALADTYIAVEDLPAALATLQEGYGATGDAALGERLEDLTNQAGQARSGDGPQNLPPWMDQELPAELWVLVKQEYERYVSFDHSGSATFFYDTQGYMIRKEAVHDYGVDHIVNDVFTWEFDDAAGQWRYYNNGQLDEAYSALGRVRGTDAALSYSGGVFCAPDPTLQGLSVAIEEAGRVTNQFIVNERVDWHYAQYSYDEYGNPSRIDSYIDGAVSGVCQLEWALLRLGADGQYNMVGN